LSLVLSLIQEELCKFTPKQERDSAVVGVFFCFSLPCSRRKRCRSDLLGPQRGLCGCSAGTRGQGFRGPFPGRAKEPLLQPRSWRLNWHSGALQSFPCPASAGETPGTSYLVWDLFIIIFSPPWLQGSRKLLGADAGKSWFCSYLV